MTQQISTVRLKRSWFGIMLSVITAVATLGTFLATFSVTIMTGVNEFPDFRKRVEPYKEYLPSYLMDTLGPSNTINFNSSKLVSVGDQVQLVYTLSNKGYYSLWNKNSAGEVKRIFPEHSKNSRAIENSENFKGIQDFIADKGAAEETMILLWTPSNPQHPNKLIYPNESAFNQYIKNHKSYDFDKKVASIQIR